MSVRTWPNPTVRAAELSMEEARTAMHRAERLYKLGLSDRDHQLTREAEIEREGGWPFYVPRGVNAQDRLADLMQNPTNQVHRWIGDEELAQRKAAVEVTTTAFEEAEAAYTAARAKGKPVTETTIRNKAKRAGARYAVNREMTVAGVRYGAGQPIPDATIDGLDHWKIQRWIDAGLIRLVN